MSDLPPGLSGYRAAVEDSQRKNALDLQNVSGLMALQSQMEMKPLQAAQLRLAVENAQTNAQLKKMLMGGAGTPPSGGTSAPLAFGEGGISLPGGSQGNLNTGQTAPSPQPVPQGQNGMFGIDPRIGAMLLSGDAGMGAFGKAILEQQKPVNVRPGGTVYVPGQGPIYSAPAGGIQIQNTPQGPQAIGIPGFAQASAAQAAPVEAAKAGGREYGSAPYQLSSVNTQGAPSLMTRQQQIESATGRPMPSPLGMQIPQAVQVQRDREASNIDRGLTPQGDRPAIPSSNVLPSRGPGLRLQDQGESAEQKEYGQTVGKQAGVVNEDAAKAAVANRYLDIMEGYAKDFTPGKLTPLRSNLIQWGQALGVPMSKEDQESAGSIQGLTSIAIKMAGQATRQSDAQPSQLQYFKILESMPDAQRTPEGFQRIVSYMRDLNSLNIIKAQELMKWRQEHNGTADGFEAQWPNVSKNLPFAWNTDKSIQDAGAKQSAQGGVRRYNPATGGIE